MVAFDPDDYLSTLSTLWLAKTTKIHVACV